MNQINQSKEQFPNNYPQYYTPNLNVNEEAENENDYSHFDIDESVVDEELLKLK